MKKNQTEGSFYFSEKTFFFLFHETIGLDIFFFKKKKICLMENIQKPKQIKWFVGY